MSLSVTFDAKRMPHTTEFLRITRSPERLYYLLLFSGDSAGANGWSSWVNVGFNLAVKEAPPGTAKSDRVKVTTYPDPRHFAVELQGGNGQVIAELKGLLMQIESERGYLSGKDASTRSKEL